MNCQILFRMRVRCGAQKLDLKNVFLLWGTNFTRLGDGVLDCADNGIESRTRLAFRILQSRGCL